MAPAGVEAPPPRRVVMPSRWADAGLTGFVGDACFVRPFGYPGRADPGTEHIWLTCDGSTGRFRVILNQTLLSEETAPAFAFDVTPLMTQRNRLEIHVHGDSDAAGLWGEVALEIRRAAFLADVTVARDGSAFVLTGRAVGVAPHPLELYTLVDRRHVDYREIMPTPAGQPFRIELVDLPADARAIRMELINLSTVWYVVEVPIS